MASTPAPIVSLSSQFYGLLLIAYPSHFREEYGHHMAEVFRDCCRDAQRQHGTPGVIGLWLPTLGDLAATAVVEHISERSGNVTISTLIRWSGLASILTGLLWIAFTFTPWIPSIVPALLL